MEEDKVLSERKEKIFSFFKKDFKYVGYIILAAIVFLAVRIRTLNLPLLRDITTGGWTLGPDLDPFFFLRMAKYIILHGKLMVVDMMRYVPLGYESINGYILFPYLIAWFHKIASIFGSSSVEQSAAIFPVFMFVLTVIAFFFLVRKIFLDNLGDKKASIIALIASFFLSVSPSLLPRTIAGIPEKESAAFFFLFLALCFFLYSWMAKTNLRRYSFAALAGLATAAMALIWGGFFFIFLTIALSVSFAFIIGQVDFSKLSIYAIWLAVSSVLMMPFSTRYHITNLITSTTTGIAFAVLFILVVHHLIFNTRLKNYFESERFSKIPKPVISLVIALVVGFVVVLVLFGTNFIAHTFGSAFSTLINPTSSDRFSVTVAENRQPYFSEWASSFGPIVGGIPLLFWLFFIGSIYLFYHLADIFEKKERILSTLAYAFFLVCIIFSRYSSSSIFNGTNATSIFAYFIGVIVLMGTLGFYYFKYYKKGAHEKLNKLDFGLILIFVFFFLGIVSARGAVRTIMVLVPPVSIIIAYFATVLFSETRDVKDELWKIVSWTVTLVVIISLLYSGFVLYSSSSQMAESYAPSSYNQQWQKAMSWVRENTPVNAVFGHWWDYGYWVQTIGERATVLDGGNSIVYWNYMMGRYALTAPDDQKAIEYLYSHNATHFLIDSSDIGKYGAFSSIGSDENYDRRSWMPIMLKDERYTKETKNITQIFYPGGTSLDGDIIYEQNGTKIFLPEGKAGVGAVVLERNQNGTLAGQPHAIFVYQDKQYSLPLRYIFDTDKLIDFGSGLEAGVFVFPRLLVSQGSTQIDKDGALLYLSSKTVKSQVARLYLYNEDNPYFKLAHVEDDFVVAQIKEQFNSQNLTIGNFVYYGDLRGPIKIWEIKYPSGMSVKEEYLRTTYPNESLRRA